MSTHPSFDRTDPEHFCTGTIGPKGQRVFFVQAGAGGEIVTLKVEKQQVTALADYLERLLEDLPELREPVAPAPRLVPPVTVQWAIGGLGVIYNERADRIVLVAEELVFDEDDDEAPASDASPAEARFHLTRAQVQAWIAQAREIVAAGRPPCPYCGRPFDPVSGFCPCVN
jgi:uncharacterized repeat protein (TIGR03847 family)